MAEQKWRTGSDGKRYNFNIKPTDTGVSSSAAQTTGSSSTAGPVRADAISEVWSNPEIVGKKRRSTNLPPDGTPKAANRTTAEYSAPPETKDWRVRLSLPVTDEYEDSLLLNPLRVTNGLVFPITPSVIMQYSANYDTFDPAHNNYQFRNYVNSEVQAIQITGTFLVQNQDDARYWVAAIHYLRSVTKMSYGQSSNRGQPPPVVKLNGYGDYVFKDIPVIITTFMTDLPSGVDYISTNLEAESGNNSAVSWAPSSAEITVNVQPIYSRRQVESFSLDSFVKGGYVKNGKGFL